MDEPLALDGLMQGGWRECTFRPFRDGVEICDLRNS